MLLRLRRAGLLEARRGRHGGYRLQRPAGALSLAEVLAAVAPPAEDQAERAEPEGTAAAEAGDGSADGAIAAAGGAGGPDSAGAIADCGVPVFELAAVL